ncbi:MAG: NAD-dependent dehydratase [Chloroflexi bacterium RBG_19FT_COMBO_47_15]|nr:MAG: NAD-dependent dehydratase [Chloroflexi bacterium RBG_19FT_COMBO_47_15]
MKWSETTVLVTGAGGFIGSHLAEHLVELGAHVKAFVRYNSRNDWGLLELIPRHRLDKIEVVTGDLRDADAIHHVTDGVQVIFHLGSLIAIPYSYIHPRETIETNMLGTLNVLTAARRKGIEKIVHTSTSEVYGTAQYVPIDEKHPLQGQSPYSASKIGADMIAESFRRSFEVPLTIIRPFNAFGPRQSARAVIPAIIIQALTKEQILLGSLHPTRDYTYIDDIVEAFRKAAESSNSLGEVINIGSNFEISIGEIAKKVTAMVGRNIGVVTDSKRTRPEKSEVERLWCNNSKAKRLLGWQPKIGFDEGLGRTIKWISDNLSLYKPELYNV